MIHFKVLFVVLCCSFFTFGQSGDYATKQTTLVIDSILSTQQISEVTIRYQAFVNQTMTEQFVSSSSIFRLSGSFIVLDQEAGLLNKNPTRTDYFRLDRVTKFITDQDRLIIYLEMPR